MKGFGRAGSDMVGTTGRKRGIVRTLFWGAILVLVAWAFVDLAGRYLGLGAPGSATLDSVSMPVAVAALVVAAAAIALAVMAMRSARESRREVDVIVRALDLALNSRSEGSGTFDVADINAIVAREVERLVAPADAAQPPAKPAPAKPAPAETADAAAGHSVSASARPQATPVSPERPVGGVERLVGEAIRRGAIEISLRPIVSLARGAAAGFDVFAHFDAGGDRQFDVGRLRVRRSAADLAAFERMLVMEAIGASRRIIGGGEGDALLHVPVSQALLSSRGELAAVLEAARAHSAAAGSIVLDLPLDALARRAVAADTLNGLANAGIAFAVEADDAATVDTGVLGLPGMDWVRLPAAQLLGQRRERTRAMGGQEIADAVRNAGLTIIADEVQSDNDAIALVDIGVDLMAGPRFSGPRRLRREPGMAAA